MAYYIRSVKSSCHMIVHEPLPQLHHQLVTVCQHLASYTCAHDNPNSHEKAAINIAGK